MTSLIVPRRLESSVKTFLKRAMRERKSFFVTWLSILSFSDNDEGCC